MGSLKSILVLSLLMCIPKINAQAGNPVISIANSTFVTCNTIGNDGEALTFPINIKGYYKNQDDGVYRINKPFLMMETELPLDLWIEVYNWATDSERNEKRYYLSKATYDDKKENYGRYPVYVTYRNAIIWCNAFTEYAKNRYAGYEDIECVYYADSEYTVPLRKIDESKKVNIEMGSNDNPYIMADSCSNIEPEKCTAQGFRIPARYEWDFAARYQGTKKENSVDYIINGYDFGNPANNQYWTKGNSASGASKSYEDLNETKKFAWVFERSTDIIKGNRLPNFLGIYDMCGNVREWAFDRADAYPAAEIVSRGGDYGMPLTIALGNYNGEFSNPITDKGGVRIVKNVENKQ